MRLVLSLLLLFFVLGAQAQFKFSAEESKQDFEVFRRSMEEAHPGLYTYFTKEQVDKFFLKAEKRIEHGANGHVLHQSLLECVSSIRDAHTRIRYPRSWQDYMGMNKLLPLRVWINDGKIHVLEDLSKKSMIKPGSEIIAINGIHAVTLQGRLNRHTPCDGNVQHFKNAVNSEHFSKNLLNLYPACTAYEVTFRTPSGELAQSQIDGISEADLHGTPEQDPLIAFSINEEEGSATLTISSFNYEHLNSTGTEYYSFLKDAFKQLRKKEINDLIIDIRGNGGGDNDLGIALFSYISAGEFEYLRTTETGQTNLTFASLANIRESWNSSQWSNAENEHSGLAYSQERKHDGTNIYVAPEARVEDISKNKFAGNVLVLTDPGTFSAASIFAAVCKANHRAALLGQGTGEACDSFCGGGSTVVTLPNSGLILTIPHKKAEVVNARCNGFGRELQPDVHIEPSLKDLLMKRDVVLRKAEELSH